MIYGTIAPKQEAHMNERTERSYPALDVILRDWLTTKQVAEMHNMAESNVRYLCARRWQQTQDAMRIGREWYIRPETAQAYQKSERTGRYPQG